MNGYYFVNTELHNKRAHSVQILNTVEGVNVGGGNLTIVAPKFSGSNWEDKDLFEYYGIKVPFKIEHLFSFWQRKTSRLGFILFGGVSILYFVSLVLRKKVDYIYFRSEFFYPLSLAASLLGVKYFYEVHRLGRDSKTQKMKERLAKNAEGVVTLTNELREKFLSFNENIHVAHDAVNLDRFNKDLDTVTARKQFCINKKGTICLYIGTISEKKGSDIILRNAAEFSDINFYLVGIQNLELPGALPKNVIVRDPIPQEDVAAFQQIADVLIMTNPESIYSQSPIKLFEYMASGRPIISSDLVNIREVLNKDTVIFYKAGSDKDFVRALREYQENRDKLKVSGAKNKELVKKYTWTKRGAAIAKFVNGV